MPGHVPILFSPLLRDFGIRYFGPSQEISLPAGLDFPVVSDAVTIGADIDVVIAGSFDDVARCQGITVQTIFRKDLLALQYSLRLWCLVSSASSVWNAAWNGLRSKSNGVIRESRFRAMRLPKSRMWDGS